MKTGEDSMRSYDYPAQRADFNLRNEFIGLETVLYKISHRHYAIVCLSLLDQFEHIFSIFEKSIHPMGEAIKLMNIQPLQYKERLEQIPFTNPVAEFRGIPLTKSQLFSLFESKFHTFKFESVYVNHESQTLFIELADTAQKEMRMVKELYHFSREIISLTETYIKYVPNDYKEIIAKSSLGLVAIQSIAIGDSPYNIRLKIINATEESMDEFRQSLALKWPEYTIEIRNNLNSERVEYKEIINHYVRNTILSAHKELEKLIITFFESELNDYEKQTIKSVIQMVDTGITEFSFEPKRSPIPLDNNRAFEVKTHKSMPFSTRDADLWFKNAEAIYEGEYTKEKMPFYSKDSTACYLDFSLFSNLNLRIHLLLYDLIYLAPPLELDHEGNMVTWLQAQNIEKEELWELIRKGRIKLVLTSDEARYNQDLLTAAFSVNEISVVTRRGISALLAAEFTNLSRSFGLNDLTIKDWELLRIGCEKYAKRSGISADALFNMIVWPIQARNKSMEIFTFGSPIQLASIGVHNNIPTIVENEAINFEFMVNSPAIYIASALDSTYYPFRERDNGKLYSDSGVAHIIGDLLNIYKNKNKEQRQTWVDSKRILQQEASTLTIFDVSESIPITEFDLIAERHQTRQTLRGLLNEFETLTPELRKKRIDGYNQLLYRIGEENSKQKVDLKSYALGGAGLIPTVGTWFSVIGMLRMIFQDVNASERQRVYKLIDKLSEKENSEKEKQELFVLNKINRAARIKG